MPFDWEYDEITLDITALSEAFDGIAEDALNDIRVAHEKLHRAGKKPDGSTQEKYEESYSRAIKANKVPFKDPGSANKATLIQTGEMLSSRQVKRIKDGAIMEFIGADNKRKASELRNRGFGLHYFSKLDLELIEKKIKAKDFATKIRKLIEKKRVKK